MLLGEINPLVVTLMLKSSPDAKMISEHFATSPECGELRDLDGGAVGGKASVSG
jgi:hypothetical protein